LVGRKATVAAVFFLIGGLDVAAEMSTVDLGNLAFTTDNAAPHFLCHRFTALVQQHESGLVGEAKITREGERALALYLVAEHGDRSKVALQGQLVRSEQRSRGNREILFAALATEAERTIRTAGFIGIKGAAERADRRAVGIGPSQRLERGFSFPVSVRKT
jgi:hypothetical protein